MSEWIFNNQLNQSFKQTGEGVIEWRPKAAPATSSGKKRWKARPLRQNDVYFVHAYFDVSTETITLRFYEWSSSKNTLVKRKPDEVFDYNLRGEFGTLSRAVFCNYQLFNWYSSHILDSDSIYGIQLSKIQKTIVQYWNLSREGVTHVPGFRETVATTSDAVYLYAKPSTSFCGMTLGADLLSLTSSDYRYILTVYDAVRKVNVIEQEITNIQVGGFLSSGGQYDNISESLYLVGSLESENRGAIYKLQSPFTIAPQRITPVLWSTQEQRFLMSLARDEDERFLLSQLSGTLFSTELRGFTVDGARRQLIYWYRSRNLGGHLIAVSYNLDTAEPRLLVVTPTALIGGSEVDEGSIVFTITDIYQVSDEYIMVIMINNIFRISISSEVSVLNISPDELVALDTDISIKATTDKPL